MANERVFTWKLLVRSFLFSLVLLLVPTFAHGQTGGSGGKPNPSPTTTQPGLGPPPFQQERRTVLITGRVLLDDGRVPSERVTIERVCGGRARNETSCDSHGQFSFQMGSAVQDFQDASVGSMDMASNVGMGSSSPILLTGMGNEGVTDQEIMNCEVRAKLPGFHSDSISLAGRQISHRTNVGTIVLHRIGKVDGTRISAKSGQAPAAAKQALERGQNLLKKQDAAGAAEEFRKAIELYPKYAEAQLALSVIYARQGRQPEARQLLEQAIECDPKFLPPYLVLEQLAIKEQDWGRLAELSERTLSLNPYQFPVAYYYHAVANYNLQKFEIAEKSLRTARQMDSQYRWPQVDFLLANVLLHREDYVGAAEQLRTFLLHAPAAPETQAARGLLAEVETKLAKTVD